MLIHFGILLCVVASRASPLFGGYDEDDGKRVLYDQKQKGEWNVHADLKNFLFVIIPSSRTAANSSSSSSIEQGLLYLLSKTAHSHQRPHQHHHHHQPQHQKPEDVPDVVDSKHFIESKSAPYQVDISKNSGGLLSKLYPDKPKQEGILVAKSPTISLLKDSTGSERAAKTLVLAIPSEDIVITRAARKTLRKKARDDQLKKGGSGEVDCEAGKVKDSYGKCKELKY